MPQKQVTNPKLEIDGTSIECVNSVNYLGTTIDKHLNWQDHSFIPSSLNYGISVWGFNTNRLFKLQKRAVRVISKSKFNAHTDPFSKTYRFIKKEDLHKLNVLTFYYKLIHKNISQYFHTNMILAQHSHIHSYPTRNNKKLVAPKIRHEFARKCIKYNITQIVNTTPFCITGKM